MTIELSETKKPVIVVNITGTSRTSAVEMLLTGIYDIKKNIFYIDGRIRHSFLPDSKRFFMIEKTKEGKPLAKNKEDLIKEVRMFSQRFQTMQKEELRIETKAEEILFSGNETLEESITKFQKFAWVGQGKTFEECEKSLEKNKQADKNFEEQNREREN